jgi:hypothetical protein
MYMAVKLKMRWSRLTGDMNKLNLMSTNLDESRLQDNRKSNAMHFSGSAIMVASDANPYSHEGVRKDW